MKPFDIHDTPELTRAYLTTIAETIQTVLMPCLAAEAHGAARDCLRIITRVAAQGNTDCSSPEAIPQNGINAARDEGEAFRDFNARADALLSRIVSASAPSARPFDPAPVEAFLRAHPSGGASLKIIGHKMLVGGRSKVTVLLTQEGAVNLPREMVLRQDWSDSVVGSSVLGEFELLRRLHDNGIKVPAPLAQNPRRSADVNPYILLARSDGRTLSDHHLSMPPVETPVLQLAEQLGRIHALDARQFLEMPGITERNYTLDQILATLRDYKGIIERFGTPRSVLAMEVLLWLERNAERAANGPRALVHGDLGVHNSLYEGEELTVILDWELAHVGCAAYDLGYLRNAIVDDLQWARFMQAYTDAGGPRVTPFLVDYFHLFGCVWFYQLVLQARAALCAGALHDAAVAAACADIMPVSMLRMANSFERAENSY